MKIVNLKLDSSALKKSYCDRAFQLAIMRGHTSMVPVEPLIMGKAIHRYAHRRARGDEMVTALRSTIDDYLEAKGVDSNLLISACSTYNPALFLPLINFDHLEMYFEFLFWTYKSDDLIINIYICGTVDRLGIDVDKRQLVAYDYKSTRKYRLADVVNDYRYTVQFMFYYWVIRMYHDKVPALFNVLELCKSPNNIFIQPIPILLSAKPPTWNRGPLLQFEAHLDEFDKLVALQCASVCSLYEEFEHERLLAPPTGIMSDACTRCDFAPACHTQLAGKFDELIDALFTTRAYDPSSF